MSATELNSLVASALSELDKAVVALSLDSAPGSPRSAAQLAERLENAGSPTINRSRLRDRLASDRRVVRDGDGFRVAPKAQADVAALAAPFVGPSRPPDSRSAIDSTLFDSAHGYIRNVVHQINVSYDHSCFDCTAVMIRRLFETLVIDAFEKQSVVSEIQNAQGDFLMLSDLIAKLRSTSTFTVSRQTKQAASYLKDVGDWSAHNRRHRAQKSDIDKAAGHLRLASSDLLHLAGQASD